MSSTASAGLAIVSPNTHFVLGETPLRAPRRCSWDRRRCTRRPCAPWCARTGCTCHRKWRPTTRCGRPLRDIEHGEEIGRLAGRRQHGSGAALELGDLRRHRVVGGVLQARVEIARLLKIEQLAHMLARVVLPRRVLIDGNLARLGIARAIAALHADGFYGSGHVNSVSFYTAERKSPLAISEHCAKPLRS